MGPSQTHSPATARSLSPESWDSHRRSLLAGSADTERTSWSHPAPPARTRSPDVSTAQPCCERGALGTQPLLPPAAVCSAAVLTEQLELRNASGLRGWSSTRPLNPAGEKVRGKTGPGYHYSADPLTPRLTAPPPVPRGETPQSRAPGSRELRLSKNKKSLYGN